jgi:AbrB family looped-hinge helix DNA binding protein
VRSTLDADGRVQIPKHVREEAGLEPGMELDVRYSDGRIELAPAEVGIHLEERDGFLVAVANGPMPALTDELVRKTLDEIRNERGTIYAEDVAP